MSIAKPTWAANFVELGGREGVLSVSSGVRECVLILELSRLSIEEVVLGRAQV